MANRGTSEWITGLATLRATQRQPRVRRYASAPREEGAEAGGDADGVQPGGTSATTARRPHGVGRTTMPTQNEVVCYGCGFQFVVRGRTTATQCPKCGARLSMKDETITGGFQDECITAGKVTLTRSAILDGGRITANDILLEGAVKSGKLRAHKTLELAKGATLPEAVLDARHLRIGAGASFDFERVLRLENLDVCGELKARIIATGTVTVRATGHLLGSVMTDRLVVEEGGGVNAALDVQPGRRSWPDDPLAESSTAEGVPAPPRIEPLTANV